MSAAGEEFADQKRDSSVVAEAPQHLECSNARVASAALELASANSKQLASTLVNSTSNMIVSDREGWTGWKGSPSQKSRTPPLHHKERKSGDCEQQSTPLHSPQKETLNASSLRVVIRQTSQDNWNRLVLVILTVL